MTRIVRVIGLAVVLAVTWRAGIAAAAGKFVVGYAAMNARLAPLWLAEEQGYFAKYGMESQAVFLRSATLLVTGLSSGIFRPAVAAAARHYRLSHQVTMSRLSAVFPPVILMIWWRVRASNAQRISG